MARVAKKARQTAGAKVIPAPAQAPRRRTPHRGWLLATTALLPIAAGPVMAQSLPASNAGPAGGQVVAGRAAIARGGNTTTITQGTDRAAIDWQQFNVGSQHTVQFVQPGAGSWTLNRVMTPDPSVIAGRVQANGGVAIVNQSGVVFAQGAQVNVSSLIASAAGISNENFMAGRMVFDQAPRPGARVENHGSITVADRGLAALVAPGVANSGVIRARLGRVALGAAETFVLDLAGDGLINIDVTQAVRQAPDGNAALVTNSGVIEAPGGSVLLTAQAASGLVEDLVRQTGTISAQTVGDRTGQVALRAEGGGVRVDGTIDASGGAAQRGGSVAVQATGAVTVAGTARIDASGGTGGGRVLLGTTGRGRNQTMAARTTVAGGAVVRADATQSGNGGEILVNSTDGTEMRGTLSARGGASGGNGGFVEISGQQALLISGFIDLSAPSGTPGELLLDPQNIIVSSNANVTPPTGTVTDNATTPGASFTATTGGNDQWLRVDPGAITGFNGTVTLDAGNDIVVASAIDKSNGGLGMTAGNSIAISANVSVSGALNLAATAGSLTIDADLRALSMTMSAGTGINQTGGTIASISGTGTALPLSATTAAGGISLSEAGNGSLSLTFSAPGTVSIRSGDFTGNPNGGVAGAIEIAGDSSGGDITLVAERRNSSAASAGTGTIAIHAGLTSAAGITLNADGAITQDAAGTIVTARDATGVLRIRDRTDGSATAAGSATLDLAANRIAVLDARTAGALAVSSAGFAEDVPNGLAANPTMDVTLARGASVALTGPRLNLANGAVATSGDMVLVATEAGGGAGSAATLTIGGAVTAGDGQTVRLRADRMALTGASFDGTGSGTSLALLEIGPQTAGRAMAWGGTDGTSLFLDAGSRAAIVGADAAMLRLGRTTVNAAMVTAGDIAFGSDLTFGGTLALNGTGVISEGGTTVLDVPTLVIRGAADGSGAGAVGLGSSLLNVIDALDARSAGAMSVASAAPVFTILQASSAGALTLSATAANGRIDLGAATVSAATTAQLMAGTGGIAQGAAGTLTAGSLRARSDGNISLTGSGNAIGAIIDGITAPGGNGPLLPDTNRGIYAGGTFSLATSGALSVTGAVESRGGLVDITAGSIAIGAPIAVSGGAAPTLALTTNGSGGASGAIGQTARVLTTAAGALDVTATGNVDLSRSDNSIPRLLASSAGGSFRLATSGALTVAGATSAAGSLTLVSAGAMTVGSPLTTTGTGTISLSGGSIAQTALIRPRDAAATAGGTVNLEATAGGITQGANGRIVTDDLFVLAAGNVNLQAGIALGAGGASSGWNAIARLTAGVTGNFSLLNAGNLTFRGSVAGGGAAALINDGRLVLDAGSAVQASLISLAGSGGLDLLGAVGGAGTTIVNLRSGGGTTITEGAGGSITTQQLRVSAGGDVTLASALNAIQGVAAAGYMPDVGISIRSGVPLSTIATSDTMLLANNTYAATPSGITSNDITLWAPSITFGAGAPLQRYDTDAPGSVVLIANALTTNGQAIAVGDGGLIGLAANDPTTEILIGDVFDGPPAAAPLLTPYTYSIVPDTSGNTLWISGAYLDSIIAGGTTNATLQVGRADQTARTFVIGDLTPSATFGTFRLLGGDVIIGADISAPGRTVEVVAGTGNILSSGTYTQIVTQYVYDPIGIIYPSSSFPGADIGPYGGFFAQFSQPVTASNGVITAGTLSLGAPNGSVLLGTAGHDAGVLSGSAGGSFAFRDSNGFTVGGTGISAGSTVSLTADTGNVTQAAGAPIAAPVLSANVANGSLILDGGGVTPNNVDALAATVGNNLTLRTDGSLALSGVTAPGVLTLQVEGGNLTQNASAVTAGELRVTATESAPGVGGNVTLTRGAAATDTAAAANAISAIGTSAIAGSLALRTQGNLSVNGQVRLGTAAGGTLPGTATLVSTSGTISQGGAGALTADALQAFATAGSILLNGTTANAVSTLLASSASGDLRLRTARALTVAGNIAGSGTIELEGPGITLGSGGAGGTLTAGRVLLRTGADFDPASGTTGGPDITQAAGTIETTQFSASAPGGTITLGAAGNTFGSIVAGADSNGAAASAGIVSGGNVTLTADGTAALTINAPILAGWVGSATPVTVTLRANNIDINALVDTRGPAATNRQAGTIDIAPLTANSGVVLGGATEYSGYLNLREFELQNLRAGTLAISTAGGGSFYLDTANLAGLMTGGTLLDLTTPAGLVSQFGGPLAIERLDVQAAGTVILANAANLIGEVTGLSAGGAITLASASPTLTLSGPVASSLSGATITIRANDLAIPAGGSITVPNGTVDISGVTAGRAISLGTEVANTLGLSSAEIGRIGQTTNPLVLVRIGDATSGTIALQGDVSFRDAPADASSAIGGVRALALSLQTNAASGDIIQTGAGGINIAAVSAAARQVSLASAGNAIDTIGALAGAGGGAALRSSRNLSLQDGITANATGGTLSITSDGTLTVAGDAQTTGAAGDVALTGRTGLSIAATTAISSVGGVTLTAGPASGDGVGTLRIDGTVSAAGNIAATATGTLTVAQDIVSSGGNITLATVAPGTQPSANVVIAAPSPVGPNLGSDPAVTEIRATGAGAGNVTITATGAIDQAATGTQVVANSLQAAAGTNIDLGVGDNQITELRSLAAGGAAALSVQGGLLITGLALAVGQLDLAAGTTLTVAATGTAQATGPGSVLSLTSGTDMSILGTAAGETANLTATGGTLTVSGGTVTGGGAGSGGIVTLAGAAVTMDSGATVTGETIAASLASGDITLGGSTVTALGPAGLLSLSTTGRIGVTGGAVGGNTVSLDAGTTGLTVSGATLTGGTGGITLASDGTTLLSGGTTTVTGGSLTVRGQTGAQISGGSHTAAADIGVTAAAGGASVVSGANVTATGGTIALNGTSAAISGNQARAGTDITLTASTGAATVAANGLTAGRDITLQGVTGASITGGTHAAERDLRLTATGAGNATLNATSVTATNGTVALSGVNAGIGSSTVGAGGSVALTASNQATVTGGAATAGDSIALQGAGLAQISGGTHSAGSGVSLTSSGGAANLLGAGVTAHGGAIALSGTSATIDQATVDASANVALTGAGAAISASTVTAGGDVSLTGTSGAATIANGSTAAGGDILLQGTTLAQIGGGTHAATGDVRLTAGGGGANLTGATVSATNGTVALTGVTAAIDAGTVGAGTDVTLTATAGQATVSGGGVTAGRDIALQGTTLAQIGGGTHGAGGEVRLAASGGAANLLSTRVAANGGDVTLSGTGTTIDASTVGASGTIGLTATTGAAVVSGGALTAGTDLTLQGQTLARVTGGTHAAARNVSLAAAGGAAEALGTTLTATGGSLSMSGGGATMAGAALRAGTTLSMTATGAVTTTNGSLTAGGDIALAAAGGATLSGTASTAGGATSITGQAGATLNGGSHAGTLGVSVAAPSGVVRLNATTITSGTGAPVSVSGAAAEVNGGRVASGGSLQVTATAGSVTLTAPALSAATTLGITAAGAADVRPGTSVSAGTDLSIGAGALSVTSALLSAGQDILMTTAGGATYAEASVFAGRDIRLNADGLAAIARGKFDAVNEIALSAGTVSLNQANIDPLIIRITAVNDIGIANSSLTADDIIRIFAGGTLTITDSTITTNSLGVVGSAGLLLERGLYVIGDVVVFASPTSIETVGRVVVRPRGTMLPGVAFDTRAAGATPDPLDIILPDDPGLPASQQETQVRAQNTEGPGDFGAPTSNPAGTLDFEIDAGRSAIFLLIDGGNATGDIDTAGRVGIFGTGGRVTLTGTLVDFQGNQLSSGNATALTDSARPAGGEALTRFTFNDCVVSSINCFVPQQILTIPQAPPQQVDIRLFGSRITDPDVQIPNVAEEDY